MYLVGMMGQNMIYNIIGTGLDSGIRVGNGDGKGGTNIEGGLMLARNLTPLTTQ